MPFCGTPKFINPGVGNDSWKCGSDNLLKNCSAQQSSQNNIIYSAMQRDTGQLAGLVMKMEVPKRRL